tara:strand:+ start:3756 stop:4418 length:663 start_codon:yes stop_codon:yes gene_type:complete
MNITEVTPAVIDIVNERYRQIEDEGWDTAHDDAHSGGELAIAAACYALEPGKETEGFYNNLGGGGTPYFWPWDPAWWKPKSRREDLVRAGALIIAEIERLDRRDTPKTEAALRGDTGGILDEAELEAGASGADGPPTRTERDPITGNIDTAAGNARQAMRQIDTGCGGTGIVIAQSPATSQGAGGAVIVAWPGDNDAARRMLKAASNLITSDFEDEGGPF